MSDTGKDLPLDKSEVRSRLERVLAQEHAYIRDLAAQAERARPTDEEPRRHLRLTDTFSAVLCQHLAAVDDVLLPRVRKELSHGHARVHDYVRHARGLENTLHLLKAKLYGDAAALHWSLEGVWDGIDEWLDDHIKHEQMVMHALVEHLTAEEERDLAAKLTASEERSPTRPHPYTPHTGVLGRIAHRFWARADSFWDDAEGRIVPGRRRWGSPRRDSLLSRYFTGMPRRTPESTKPGGRGDPGEP
jgi:truncated hemoglobin YjbI